MTHGVSWTMRGGEDYPCNFVRQKGGIGHGGNLFESQVFNSRSSMKDFGEKKAKENSSRLYHFNFELRWLEACAVLVGHRATGCCGRRVENRDYIILSPFTSLTLRIISAKFSGFECSRRRHLAIIRMYICPINSEMELSFEHPVADTNFTSSSSLLTSRPDFSISLLNCQSSKYSMRFDLD